ncbi:MAG: hypothetical protein LBQ62_05530, partial [Candidatus Accumulibacter sp.]|nr:hypothetical protein [Accumulibacter sp.]
MPVNARIKNIKTAITGINTQNVLAASIIHTSTVSLSEGGGHFIQVTGLIRGYIDPSSMAKAISGHGYSFSLVNDGGSVPFCFLLRRVFMCASFCPAIRLLSDPLDLLRDA